ncbi:MAG: DUF3459 domain-containing protein, partial [Pseudomonadota bacterium]|nr:DUF3459 domain-containing protein [Pseudomonadota bacterium]
FADYPADFDQNSPEDRLRQGEAFGSADLTLDEIRDPTDVATFSDSKLDWQEAETKEGMKVMAEFRDLLQKRHEHLMPLLRDIGGGVGHVLTAEEGSLAIDWQLGERRWQLRCNFSDDEATLPPVHGETIHVMPGEAEADMRDLSRFAPRSLIVACG